MSLFKQHMHKPISHITSMLLIAFYLVIQTSAAEDINITLASDIKWEPLNPARGDNSPKAGTLWGDRNASVSTGFLAKFKDGFSSPPHIHNVTYRAVVINGLIHNDDPDAKPMWMPSGSFWTQPKGEAHITAARGANNIALVEIDKGPYLVQPTEDAFDSGERPVNVDASNIVWINLPGMPSSINAAKIAYLWGELKDGHTNGSFIKLPAGFTGKIQTEGSSFHAVVITGQLQHLKVDKTLLKPGSYFGSKTAAIHEVSSNSETIIYVRTNGKFNIINTLQ